MKRLLTQVIATVLFLYAAVVPAQSESWFQVEVIVFEYTRPDTDGESWYGNPGLPDQQNSIDLVQGPAPHWLQETKSEDNKDPDQEKNAVDRIPYLALPAKAQNLDGVYRILTLSGDYRPLYHASWQQPGLDERQARYVHFSGVREEKKENDTGPAAMESLYQAPEVAFDALLRLRSTRFLHLDVDTAYFPVDPGVLQAAASDDDELPAYRFADYVRMQTSRRIRLKELHYFDHPLFGLIVQVTRIEDDKKSEE